MTTLSRTDIEWADFVANMLTGCRGPRFDTDGNRVRCDYCFADRFSHRLAGRFGYPADEPFRPTFHPDKLGRMDYVSSHYQSKFRDMPSGRAIFFLNSMGETFDPENPREWTDTILRAVREQQFTPQPHPCVILTKRPEDAHRLLDVPEHPPLPNNLWLGVSVESNEYRTRIDDLLRLRTIIPGPYHFVLSAEPMHGPIEPLRVQLKMFEWVIIGAETGNRVGRVEPEARWVTALVEQCRELKIPVFLKDNLKPYWPHELVQEFPAAMAWGKL